MFVRMTVNEWISDDDNNNMIGNQNKNVLLERSLECPEVPVHSIQYNQVEPWYWTHTQREKEIPTQAVSSSTVQCKYEDERNVEKYKQPFSMCSQNQNRYNTQQHKHNKQQTTRQNNETRQDSH